MVCGTTFLQNQNMTIGFCKIFFILQILIMGISSRWVDRFILSMDAQIVSNVAIINSGAKKKKYYYSGIIISVEPDGI